MVIHTLVLAGTLDETIRARFLTCCLHKPTPGIEPGTSPLRGERSGLLSYAGKLPIGRTTPVRLTTLGRKALVLTPLTPVHGAEAVLDALVLVRLAHKAPGARGLRTLPLVIHEWRRRESNPRAPFAYQPSLVAAFPTWIIIKGWWYLAMSLTLT